jgi:4-carboxymuconolactone decarboxylase
VRIAPIHCDHLTPDQQALFDTLTAGRTTSRGNVVAPETGVVQGPFTAMLHDPSLGNPLQSLGAALRFGGELTDRAKEIVILVTAAAWQSEFEWWAHAKRARRVGFTDGELDALADGKALALDDDVERTALEAARTLVRDGDLDDAAYERAHAVLGDQRLVELTTFVGYYALLALQMRVFRVELPAGETPRFTPPGGPTPGP